MILITYLYLLIYNRRSSLIFGQILILFLNFCHKNFRNYYIYFMFNNLIFDFKKIIIVFKGYLICQEYFDKYLVIDHSYASNIENKL